MIITILAYFHQDVSSLISEILSINYTFLGQLLQKNEPDIPAQILEFDKRFDQYGDDFIFYDYNQPEELPSALKHSYKIIVVDPPYLVSVPYLVNRELTKKFLYVYDVFYFLWFIYSIWLQKLSSSQCFLLICIDTCAFAEQGMLGESGKNDFLLS